MVCNSAEGLPSRLQPTLFDLLDSLCPGAGYKLFSEVRFFQITR